MKTLYLMGGLGNNLFQIEKSLSSPNSKVRIVTNLIDDRFYSRVFGWTFHEEAVSKLSFNNDVHFVRLNPMLVLFHLCLLFIAKKTKRVFLGVGWDSHHLTRVNFGYWQSFKSRSESMFRLRVNSDVEVNQLPVVHVRLGDSPTLAEDLKAQLNLMVQLNFNRYLVITNDKESFIESAKNLNLSFDVKQQTVTEDLMELLSAKTLIVPRSTFSLIASFMSSNLEVLYVNYEYWTKHQTELTDVEVRYY